MSPAEFGRESPPRLGEGDDVAGEGLRALAYGTRPDPDAEARAWRRLGPRLPRGGLQRWWSSGILVAGLVGAAVAAVLVTNRPAVELTAPVVAVPAPVPAPQVLPLAPPTPRAPSPARASGTPSRRLALSPRSVALPVGSAALARRDAAGEVAELLHTDEATVELAPASRARASASDAWVRVVLQRGQVGLHVEKRVAGGPGFEVVAGAYRFRVLGTRFRVARDPRGGAPHPGSRTDAVELWVDEGRVAVSRHGRALGVVGAGGHWDARAPRAKANTKTNLNVKATRVAVASVALARPADAPAAPAPAEAPPVPRARCAELADDAATARAGVTCYLALARGTGLGAETALYEIARLRRDVLGDGAGALAALEESRARFPAGTLRQEVDLSIVELLPKLNRHRDAIAEIGRLLAQGGALEHDAERAAELHVLRGNIYREVLEDFARAERDYAAAEAARAPAVGDATFLRGVCLQAAGRADEARAAFDRYLAAGPGRFGDEARRRLQRLLGH